MLKLQNGWQALKAFFLAFLALMFEVIPALALDPAKAITQYVHNVWQVEEGLPQNSIQAILQDRKGYLWLGTQEGLARFDGVRFTVYGKTNTPGFKHNSVLSLFEDTTGSLWIGYLRWTA